MNPNPFDPAGLAELRALTSDAVDELDDLGSHEPAAAAAMRAIRLTRYTLESFWIPTLDELLASQPERSADADAT